ncbi:hypothetical protein SAMN05421780_11265 [Flexibacter flexilis DSM 6793]|uniref:Uncharacterized protein n=1 Tax=Flexibacter flexilis DSM 6793 TaxID=927664 RepID=A0A1I1N3Y7_9BACT|nr:hypothetical protein SAMN05421780_11265 [Flexibacter flexilis DSM 6793]
MLFLLQHLPHGVVNVVAKHDNMEKESWCYYTENQYIMTLS